VQRSLTHVGIALLAGCALLAGARTTAAQETINQASISGRVTDEQGGVVPGATVTARQTDTNFTAEATTDGEGRFRFPFLKLGPYSLTVRLAGFADVTRTLTLTVGSAFEFPITLRVAGVDASLTVQGQAPVLEAA
jgi:Carboxypeptidase regulatory-like domain